jgi:hypothetical protein
MAQGEDKQYENWDSFASVMISLFLLFVLVEFYENYGQQGKELAIRSQLYYTSPDSTIILH